MTYIPKVRKIMKKNNVFIERILPKEGEINIKKGTKVEPFTKLGITKVAYGSLPIKGNLKLEGKKRMGDFFYTGDTIGRVGGKKVIAPFDGRIQKIDNKVVYEQEERDFWLLAGVWGEVVGMEKGKSVLLKSQTIDLHFAACTRMSYAGELIVFPNPSKLLELQYLEKFSKDSFGKIIYLGDHVDVEAVEKAVNLGVAGLIAGSADRQAFSLAKSNNMFLGIFSGFGNIPTPKPIYEFLKDISNRFVFLQGSRGVVRVPNPKPFMPDEETTGGMFSEIREGLTVQVLEPPFLGFVGVVERIEEGEKIFVKLYGEKKLIEVKIPNILALE